MLTYIGGKVSDSCGDRLAIVTEADAVAGLKLQGNHIYGFNDTADVPNMHDSPVYSVSQNMCQHAYATPPPPQNNWIRRNTQQ